ncbi:MAG TPA: response regulator [Thermoanaerobaculia bacterium]|nr:response regulator [Thermoanaerobaculia bacterium]
MDDAPEVLKLICGILEGDGHEVVALADGEGLERRVEADDLHLVLLDVVLPGRSGYQILRDLKRKPATRAVPVVLVSSKTEPTDVEWGRSQGADDYLTKPFTADELLTRVRRLAG